MNTKQLNVRLPVYAHEKLASLRKRMGATYVQVITAAIDALEEKRRGYNGWSNYETWAVALWLDNEEPTYRHMMELVEQFKDTDELTPGRSIEGMLADAISDFVEEQAPIIDEASMFSDLLSHAIHGVDWYEIAEHYLED